MGDVTRNLLPYAIGRNTVETVILVTLLPQESAADDGSFSFYKEEIQTTARVVALTSSEIQRLREAGITLNQGFSVALVGERQKAPDQVIRADGTLLKVKAYTIEEGASVFLCDMPPLGSDGTSYGSGYSSP